MLQRLHGHIQRMEETEVRAVGDMGVPGKKAKGETKSEVDGWSPKGYAGTADHPGGSTGQNILEIKNTGP